MALCYINISVHWKSILTWRRRYPDPSGGSPTARTGHCTIDQFDLCDLPKCGRLGRVIYVSGGLRSRYPLNKTQCWNKFWKQVKEILDLKNVHLKELGLVSGLESRLFIVKMTKVVKLEKTWKKLEKRSKTWENSGNSTFAITLTLCNIIYCLCAFVLLMFCE